MGRGARPKVRWKNERVRRKKARDKRRGAATPEAAAAASTGTSPK